MGEGAHRNQPCWCGSGEKYKRCHYRRADDAPMSLDEAMAGLKRAHRPRECLHPHAASGTCSGRVIASHSIQRRGSLAHIASNGHVLGIKADFGRLEKSGGRIVPHRMGLSKASVFPGFCAKHDAETFRPLETGEMALTSEQAFLLSYRALCKELFQKRAHLEVTNRVLADADRGRHEIEQMLLQRWRHEHELGASLGLRDLSREKDLLDAILLSRDWDRRHRFLAIELRERPTIVSSGAIIPECDFDGNPLAELGRPDLECDLLSFAIVATDEAGFAIWGCRADSDYGMQFLRGAAALSDEQLVQGAARFAFEFVENTYISPCWWDALPAERREAVVERINSGLLDDPGPDRLVDDGVTLVDWAPAARIARLQDP